MEKIKLENTIFPDSYYFKQGQGPTVILIHGFAEDHTIWKRQVECLSLHYTCLVPALPGSGLSGLFTSSISIEDLAKFVFLIGQQEAVVKPILLGHSMGGYIAMAYAELYKDTLGGLGLIHSTAFADNDIKIENRLKSIKLIEGGGKELFLKTMIPNLYAEAARTKYVEEVNLHLTTALAMSSLSLIAYYNAMIARPDRSQLLTDMNVPILFAIGKQDNAVAYADVLKQSTMPTFSFVHLWEEVGHTGMIEASEKMNSILNKYCEYVCNPKLR